MSNQKRNRDELYTHQPTDLGISTLRYPALWERVAPNHPDELNWARTDERLNRLRERKSILLHGSILFP